jgi:hypothetical protein
MITKALQVLTLGATNFSKRVKAQIWNPHTVRTDYISPLCAGRGKGVKKDFRKA